MNIKEFINKLQTSEVAMSDLIVVKQYISSAEKVRISEEVVDFSVKYDRGFIKFDSYKKNLAFIFAMIEAHTDLVFSNNWDEKIQEYDALYENDMVDVIIDAFKKDYNASREVLDMMCDDLIADNSIEASVAKVAQSVVENLDIFVGALADKIKDFDIEKVIPKNLDLDKLQQLLNRFK